MEKHGAKVCWDKICYPLKEGGLGIKRMQDWNNAALLKLIWRILTKSGSSWTEWVHTVLLKGHNFWEVKAPAKSSWAWRKIMNSRQWCKGLFRSKIGDGKGTSLWFDYWLPDGKNLYDSFPAGILASTGLGWNAKVKDIIRNGEWEFPRENRDLQQAWSTVNFLPHRSHEDKIIWSTHASGNFSIASAWNILRKTNGVFNLHGLIWYHGHVPRYSWTLWLASMGRLSTMDRPIMGNFTGTRMFVLCALETESHDHLFFKCRYTDSFWTRLTSHANHQWPSTNWADILRWARKKFNKKKRFNSILAKHTLATSIYFIWTERNLRIFQAKNKPVEVLLHEAIIQIRLLLMQYKGHIPDYARVKWRI